MRKPILRRLARLSPLLLLPAVVGCNVLGAVAYKLSQDPTIPAKFVLDKNKPTLVLVENFRTPDLSAKDSELLARTLTEKLEAKKVAPIIKAEKVLDLRNTRPKEFGTMTIPQIAQAVGAEQVVYVDLQGSQITSLTGTSMFQARAAAYMKVVDAKTGASLYPTDSVEGVGVTYETNALKGNEEGTYPEVRSALFDGLARAIGHHFYEWKAEAEKEESEK